MSIITRYSNNVVGAYDPAAVFPEVFSQIKVFSTSQECIKASEVIIVVTPWPEFAKIDLDQILNIDMKKLIVIDPFKIFGNLAKFNETKIGKLFVK